MRPIVTERGGDGGGSRTLGVVERGRRPGTEAGPGGGRVQRQHRGRSMTKCGSGGAEVEEAARQVCGRNFFLFFHAKRRNGYAPLTPIAIEHGSGGGGGAVGSWVPRIV
jgi:hypothetical protein